MMSWGEIKWNIYMETSCFRVFMLLHYTNVFSPFSVHFLPINGHGNIMFSCFDVTILHKSIGFHVFSPSSVHFPPQNDVMVN